MKTLSVHSTSVHRYSNQQFGAYRDERRQSGSKGKGSHKFDYNVTLMDIPLKGEYLFVHDDAAMARGEACTYVYKGVDEKPGKPYRLLPLHSEGASISRALHRAHFRGCAGTIRR